VRGVHGCCVPVAVPVRVLWLFLCVTCGCTQGDKDNFYAAQQLLTLCVSGGVPVCVSVGAPCA